MSTSTKLRLRLYVAANAQNSAFAIANLDALCQACLSERPEIEVVDVLKHPKRALADGVFMTPTLLRLAPLPLKRIVGTLSETQIVRQALGLTGIAT